MGVIIIEGPDGSGKSTLLEALKAADPSIETMHPGKPPNSHVVLLQMINDQFHHNGETNRIYDRVTCLSEWVYRPFRVKISDNPSNEAPAYGSLLNAQLFLALRTDWQIIYCRPSTDDIIAQSQKFTEYDTEETKEVVMSHMKQVIQRYDSLMTQMMQWGTNVVQFDYTRHSTDEFVKAILGE